MNASIRGWANLGEGEGQGRVTIVYRFDTTLEPRQQMRLKIEINSREHFSVLGLQRRTFTVNSPWYSDSADITVYGLEELLGTKLRALYQRKKGRDLYDLWRVLDTEKINHGIVIECFQRSQVSTTRLYLFAAPKVAGSFFYQIIEL